MNTEEVVLGAVQGLNNGESKQFDILVNELTKETLEGPLVYLNAFRGAIKYINRKHETLIGVILSIDWTCYDTETANTFIEFLAELISAKTFYVRVCIYSLIKQFVSKAEIYDDNLLVALQQRYRHAHTALQTILHIAPISSKYVAAAVKSYFPYRGKCLFILETYVVHILQVTAYAHDVRSEILQLVIDKLIAIDVLTPKEKVEPENVIALDQVSQYDIQQENIEKLDQLMTLLFAYIDSISIIDGTLDYSQASLLFKDLLSIHESLIMKTRSSHIQFLLFYMTSLHKDFTEAFIETCWRMIRSPNYAGILRQSSACYLASFLARSKFLGEDTIRREVKKLSEWLNCYIDYFQDDRVIQANRTKHAPFYGACQALFYVIVYHHKTLLETMSGIIFLKSLNIIRVVTSRLNPLKFCLDSVVDMFARYTRMHQIVFCYSIIERNNRSLEQMNEGGLSEPEGYMANFFPFDPYILPKSGKWIEPLYFPWHM